MLAEFKLGPELTAISKGVVQDARRRVAQRMTLGSPWLSAPWHRGLRWSLAGLLPLALCAAIALTAAQAAPVVGSEAEAEAGLETENAADGDAVTESEAGISGSTIFICDVGTDGTTTCVTIQGELEVCAKLPPGIIRRSYIADPENQPSVVPPTPDDIESSILGLDTGSEGAIVDVQEIYGPGEGILDIIPEETVDEFSDPTERFHIASVYKGDFTTTWQACNILAAGQQITIYPGGLYSDIEEASDEMLEADRNLKILIALNTIGLQIDPQLATRPVTPSGQPGDADFSDVGGADGTGGSTGGTGGTGGGPSPPPPGDFSTGGDDMGIVPDVLGLTLAAATAEITGEGFVVGDVTVQGADAAPSGGLIIGSAHAQEEPTVVDQNPNGGAQKTLGSKVDLVMSGFIAISEPSSLVLFIVGLALLAMVLWVRRPRT